MMGMLVATVKPFFLLLCLGCPDSLELAVKQCSVIREAV